MFPFKGDEPTRRATRNGRLIYEIPPPSYPFPARLWRFVSTGGRNTGHRSGNRLLRGCPVASGQLLTGVVEALEPLGRHGRYDVVNYFHSALVSAEEGLGLPSIRNQLRRGPSMSAPIKLVEAVPHPGSRRTRRAHQACLRNDSDRKKARIGRLPGVCTRAASPVRLSRFSVFMTSIQARISRGKHRYRHRICLV